MPRSKQPVSGGGFFWESPSLQHAATFVGQAARCCEGAALGAAVGAENIPFDADLAYMIEFWPTLPPAIREAILVMLRAAE